MSTLSVSNITDGTTTVGTEYVVNGSAKAYCNGGPAGSVNDGQSLNISSLTDVGTGDINFILTNAVVSTSTTCVTSAGSASARVGQTMGTPWSNTSTLNYQCYNTSGSAVDAGQNYMSVFGELA